MLITPKNPDAKATLANIGQRQAIAHDAATLVGVTKEVDEPYFTPLVRRDGKSGKVVLAIIPAEKDRRGAARGGAAGAGAGSGGEKADAGEGRPDDRLEIRGRWVCEGRFDPRDPRRRHRRGDGRRVGHGARSSGSGTRAEGSGWPSTSGRSPWEWYTTCGTEPTSW